jgi:hypothetical protein
MSGSAGSPILTICLPVAGDAQPHDVQEELDPLPAVDLLDLQTARRARADDRPPGLFQGYP